MELIDLVNSVISNDLNQMVTFPTWISGCDFHSPALLYLFISSDASICSTMAFSPLGNSDHVVVSVSIDFPSYSQWHTLFHHIAYDYSCAEWDGFRDHLREYHGRISLNSMLLLLVNFMSRSGWNWCIYPSSKVSGQASLISMIFRCLCCCHSS